MDNPVWGGKPSLSSEFFWPLSPYYSQASCCCCCCYCCYCNCCCCCFFFSCYCFPIPVVSLSSPSTAAQCPGGSCPPTGHLKPGGSSGRSRLQWQYHSQWHRNTSHRPASRAPPRGWKFRPPGRAAGVARADRRHRFCCKDATGGGVESLATSQLRRAIIITFLYCF